MTPWKITGNMTTSTERRAYGPTGQPLGINIMTTIHLHDVTTMTTETNEYAEFTCETITVETKDGQKVKLKLFREKPVAEPVNETELLITSIKGSLASWGLADFPEYDKLAYKLAMEASEGLNIDLKAYDLCGAFVWADTVDGHDYWAAVDVFAQNNRYTTK